MLKLFDDIILGLKKKHFWFYHGLNDIKKNYRRKFLGQLWITLNAYLFILGIYLVFSNSLSYGNDNYLIYLSIGYILWIYINNCINLSTSLFFNSKSFLLNKYWPLSAFAFRLLLKEILVFLHNIIIIPFIFLYYGIHPSLESIFFSICGLYLMIFTSFWIIIIVGIISTRFPDLSEIITSLMRIVFFLTPIIWIEEKNFSKITDILLMLNPFTYFIKIIRDPLLGLTVSNDAWIISVCLSIGAMFCALFLLNLNKHKITYWL